MAFKPVQHGAIEAIGFLELRIVTAAVEQRVLMIANEILGAMPKRRRHDEIANARDDQCWAFYRGQSLRGLEAFPLAAAAPEAIPYLGARMRAFP